MVSPYKHTLLSVPIGKNCRITYPHSVLKHLDPHTNSERRTSALFFGSHAPLKSNHFYCHITTAQVPWWVKFLWACSRQCRKTTDNLPMDRQCKKNNKQFTYGQTVQKKQQTIYIWTDSAKKQQTIYIWTDSAKKQQTIYIWTDSAKKTTNNLHMDRQCKKTALEHLQCSRQCKKNNNSNLHMDSTYLQTVQKTMCKIHIHILSTHSVL